MSTINIQQIPKDKEYLQCFRARKGYKLVQADYCLHPKTEILTKEGWKTILDVSKKDIIWQVNKNTLQGSWTYPERIIKRHYKGTMHTFGNVRGRITVTDNHRMLWAGQRNRKEISKQDYRKETLSHEGITTTGQHLITSTFSSDRNLILSEKDIWISCMLQADSSLTPYGRYRVEVAKPRKRDKVRVLLGRPGTLNKRRNKLPSESWSGIRYSSEIMVNKEFNLSNLSSECADIFVDALSFWDGTKGKGNRVYYYSTSKRNIEQVQMYLTTSGYEAKLVEIPIKDKQKHNQCYMLSIKKLGDIRLRKEDHTKQEYVGLVGCVTVPDGYIFVRSEGQTFVVGNCALEIVVLTMASQDKSLLKMYGPNSKKNDMYLFTAAHIPALGKNILRYYDPDNPTKASIDEAKKHCKKDRAIAKIVTLAANYGAFPKKMFETLHLGGIKISMSEVEEIFKHYWELYAGVKLFEQALMEEWKRNKGYIFNGFNRPLTVGAHRTKDLVNSYVQSTGHDLLMSYIAKLQQIRIERKIKMNPWIVDFHDETIWEVPDEYVQEAKLAFEDTLKWINNNIMVGIKLEADVAVVDTLAEIKCNEE